MADYVLPLTSQEIEDRLNKVGTLGLVSTEDIVPIEKGGTGAISSEQALLNLGINDYIVEQGTIGSWTYRKWNSGIAECWCAVDDTVTYEGAVLGGYLYYTGLYTYPFNFISAPTVSYNATFNSGYIAIIGDAGTVGTSGFGRVRVLSNIGDLQGGGVLVRIYAIGKWK